MFSRVWKCSLCMLLIESLTLEWLIGSLGGSSGVVKTPFSLNTGGWRLELRAGSPSVENALPLPKPAVNCSKISGEELEAFLRCAFLASAATSTLLLRFGTSFRVTGLLMESPLALLGVASDESDGD